MAEPNTLAETQAANRVLSDQLLQARAALHQLGITDQNRCLVYAATSVAVGFFVGLAVGLNVSRKRKP
jgi:hypothetical protein